MKQIHFIYTVYIIFCYLTISLLLFRHIQTGNCLEQESISRIKAQRTASSGLSDMRVLQGVRGGVGPWQTAELMTRVLHRACLCFTREFQAGQWTILEVKKSWVSFLTLLTADTRLNFLNDKTASCQAACWSLSHSAPLTITQLQSLYN